MFYYSRKFMISNKSLCFAFTGICSLISTAKGVKSVSYTHLDVYKRQSVTSLNIRGTCKIIGIGNFIKERRQIWNVHDDMEVGDRLDEGFM